VTIIWILLAWVVLEAVFKVLIAWAEEHEKE